jgi:hypothetical protein
VAAGRSGRTQHVRGVEATQERGLNIEQLGRLTHGDGRVVRIVQSIDAQR